MHLHQAANALLAALGDVKNRFARAQLARIHADERQLADKRVGHDLEHQRRKRLVIGGRELFGYCGVIGQHALHRRNIERRRQIIDHRIEQVLHALVLERRAADHRENLLRDGRLADARHDLFFGDRRAFDEFREQLVVGFGDRFDHLLAILLGLLEQIRGNLDLVELRAQRFIAPDARLHLHQIDDALELIFGADRKLNRHRPALQPVDDGIDGVIEIRAHAVHLIDEANARNAVLVGLPPHGFRLRLHAGHGVEHRHRAIQHAQTALHFGREIHVAGRVDDVDRDIAPLAGGGGRRNGDAALLLLLHPVHDGGAFMHFADLVRAAGVIEDALGGGGFTGIDVGHDADVPHFFERYSACHK